MNNKSKIEEVVENIMINKKLISTNAENIIMNTMETKLEQIDDVINFGKMTKKELLSYCKEQQIKDCSRKNKDELIAHINNIKDKICDYDGSECKDIKITREHVNKEKMCLVNGDCLNVMMNIENESIDLILCDLPYGVTKNKWDVVISFVKLWEQYNRVQCIIVQYIIVSSRLQRPPKRRV